MINKILSSISNVSMTEGRYLTDKSYKYDTIFFVARYLCELANGSNNFDTDPNTLSSLTDKIKTDFNLPEGSHESNRNYILETLSFLQYAKVIDKIDQSKYRIINKFSLDFITVSIENAYIFQYLVAYKTFENDGLWDFYKAYLKPNSKSVREQKLQAIKDIMCQKSVSIGVPNSVWASNVVKFSIMVLGLANNDYKVTRTLSIKDEHIEPNDLSANVEGTRSSSVKHNFYTKYFRLDYVKTVLEQYLASSVQQTPSTDENILSLIKTKYEAHTDYDINNENEKYARFQSLYGKDVISSLNGKDLLYRLFANKEIDKNSLIYNIEHNNYYRRFGGVGGGSSFKYPLFFYQKKNSWVTGPKGSYKLLSEQEAIEKATELRDKLVSLFDAVEELEPLDSIEKYQQLETIVLSDSLFTKQWVLKYLHMLYPDFFSTFYSREWIGKVASKLGIKVEGGNVSLNGQISLVANELGIPNVFFAHVIYELLDFDNNDEFNDDENTEVEVEDAIENKELPTRAPRTTKIHPLNAILYGAPGTGKTYATAEYAVAIIENRDIKDEDREELMKKYRTLQKEGKITFTTFHQSYGYEDFIQGLRPENHDGVMEFKPVDGVFKRIADKALKDNSSNYVIIIDEINRANMSKVLGELITLIEEDKRWGEVNQLSVTLPSGEVFVVPNNLYIVGTMNTADKSISIIDVALRRRFEFIEQQVDLSKVADSRLREVLNKINSKLKDETDSTDLLVGHAYFMNKTIDDLDKLLNRAIIPLLYEYFFDNGKKVKSVVEEAISGTGYIVDSSALGRIKVIKE